MTTNEPHRPGDIVVIGALGAVGRATTGALADLAPGRVVLTGRSTGRVAAASRAGGIPGRVADASDPASLLRATRGASVAVLALETPDVDAHRTLLASGVHVVDVGASPAHLERIAGLDGVAREHAVTAAVSVGLAPGISNLLARRAHEALGGTSTRIDITVMLGASEAHGPEAVRWTLDSLLDAPATTATAEWFALPRNDSPTPDRRRAHPFPFADAPAVAQTLGVREVTTRLTLDSALATRSLFALAALRRTPWRDSSRLRSAVARSLARVHLGGLDFCVRVDAHGPGRAHAAVAVTGSEQTRTTAAVAARTAVLLAAGGSPAGVHHLHTLPGGPSVLTDLSSGTAPLLEFWHLA